MERRVIKINLVGLICTVILIISAIVGIIVFAVTRNKNDNSNNNNNNNTNNSNQTQAPQEEPAKIENNEQKMQIMVNGEKQELSVKTYISELNYRMDYAKDLIYVDSKTNNSQVIYPIISDGDAIGTVILLSNGSPVLPSYKVILPSLESPASSKASIISSLVAPSNTGVAT